MFSSHILKLSPRSPHSMHQSAENCSQTHGLLRVIFPVLILRIIRTAKTQTGSAALRPGPELLGPFYT